MPALAPIRKDKSKVIICLTLKYLQVFPVNKQYKAHKQVLGKIFVLFVSNYK